MLRLEIPYYKIGFSVALTFQRLLTPTGYISSSGEVGQNSVYTDKYTMYLARLHQALLYHNCYTYLHDYLIFKGCFSTIPFIIPTKKE